jgi:hypothetical protein
MPNELRPAEIVWAYWAEVLALEENAIRLQPEYLEFEAA